MFPPSATSRPASRSTWAISAVVVDLPLVPVIATNGASGARTARSREKSSMSPTIGTPAALGEVDRPMRRRVGQRHPGRQHEQPKRSPVGSSEIDERESRVSGALARIRVIVPDRDLGAAFDERAHRRHPGPAKAEDRDALPAKGFDRRQSSPQLQRREPDHRQHEGDDPEAHDDLRLRPSKLLEMMMDRRHLEIRACR